MTIKNKLGFITLKYLRANPLLRVGVGIVVFGTLYGPGINWENSYRLASLFGRNPSKLVKKTN